MRRRSVALLLRIYCCRNAFACRTACNRTAHAANNGAHWTAHGCPDGRACYCPASSAYPSTGSMAGWRISVFAINNRSIFKEGRICRISNLCSTFAHKPASNGANCSADYCTDWPRYNCASCGPGHTAGCCACSSSNRVSARRAR